MWEASIGLDGSRVSVGQEKGWHRRGSGRSQQGGGDRLDQVVLGFSAF